MRDVILHGHIFKNAGSSFDWSLSKCFGDAFLDHRDDRAMRERKAVYLAEVLNSAVDLQALSSHHLCYPLPEDEGLRLHPVYLLRHPLDRVASVYAFEKRQQADTRGAKAAKEFNFREYVAWRLRDDVPRTIRDYQTCNVSGLHDRRPKEVVPHDWLRRAINHLSSIDCVGVVDRYDESMVMFEHRLSGFFPAIDLAYLRQNTTSDTREPQPIETRVHSVLERLGDLAPAVIETNSYDMALYRMANQKLDLALASIDNVAQRLTEFRERCDKLKRRWPW